MASAASQVPPPAPVPGPPAAPPEWDPRAASHLNHVLERVLRSTMGVPFPGPSSGLTPLSAALLWLLFYTAMGLLFAFGVNPEIDSDPRLVSLLVWGGLYCAAAVYLAQSSTVRIKETVKLDIARNASRQYLEAVAAALDEHYPNWILLYVPAAIATIAMAAALWALSADEVLPADLTSRILSGELIFWAVTYWVHFYCAAIAVIAAGFYSCFAAHLHLERDRFYVFGAAETPIVRGLERLSVEVLVFWSVIFLIVLSSILMAIPPEPYGLKKDSAFLFALLPVAGFFSLGVGTLVHLRTDAKVRAVLHRFTHKHAAKLQAKSRHAFDQADGQVPSAKSEVERLIAWHDRIIAGGRYGSRTGTTVSIALPLILPVVGLLVEIFG